MNPTPPGWPRISSAIFYLDPAAAIDWLCKAFDFKVRIKVEGEGLMMVAGVGPKYDHRAKKAPWKAKCASPAMLDGQMTQNLCIHVEDADAHCARARAAGATICYEPETTDYGADYWADRSYGAIDPEGHVWWFLQRVRTGKLGGGSA